MASAASTHTVGGLVGLLRVGNCVMGALGALLAAVICVGREEFTDYLPEVSLSMIVVALFTGAGNSLNDYFDRETDRVAHPNRPLPQSLVTPGQALALSGLLFVSSAFLSFLIGAWPIVIVLTSMFVMLSYEVLLKSEGLAGNLAISWLTGALFLFGGAAVDRMEVAWILFALAFLATLGREIVKDVQDVAGDIRSRRTLPMRVGEKRAGIIASGAFIGAVALSPVPYLQGLFSSWYLPAVAVADGIFIYCAMVHFADPSKGQRVAKMAMLAALAAFLLGGIS